MKEMFKKINKKYVIVFVVALITVTCIIGYSYLEANITYNSSITVDKFSCTQNNLYERMACMATPDKVKSKSVSSMTGIKFNDISSDTNGKGVYAFSSTLNNTYPIYYYRGNVDDNNVKFGGFCWKIVRTTETGGTKMIYNGLPDASGNCTATGQDTGIMTKAPYNKSTSPAYVGYMYSSKAQPTKVKNLKEQSTDIVFGNDVSYNETEKTYTLNTTFTTSNYMNDYQKVAEKYHYTCFSNSDTCETVKYIYDIDQNSKDNLHYVELNNGLKAKEYLDEIFSSNNDERNAVDSMAKTSIDNWYLANLNSKTSKIEDTPYCKQRSNGAYNAWDNNSTVINNDLSFKKYMNTENSNIEFTCSNKIDNFTVSGEYGNGKLTYPVGLLTADEMRLAGSAFLKENKNTYLDAGNAYFYTMTPVRYSENNSTIFSYQKGIFGQDVVNYSLSENIDSLRPVISLKHDNVIKSGTGSKTDPYIID